MRHVLMTTGLAAALALTGCTSESDPEPAGTSGATGAPTQATTAPADSSASAADIVDAAIAGLEMGEFDNPPTDSTAQGWVDDVDFTFRTDIDGDHTADPSLAVGYEGGRFALRSVALDENYSHQRRIRVATFANEQAATDELNRIIAIIDGGGLAATIDTGAYGTSHGVFIADPNAFCLIDINTGECEEPPAEPESTDILVVQGRHIVWVGVFMYGPGSEADARSIMDAALAG